MRKVYKGLYINGKIDCPFEDRYCKASTAKRAIELCELYDNMQFDVISREKGAILAVQRELKDGYKVKAGVAIIKQ
jgi:hypothetical protein